MKKHQDCKFFGYRKTCLHGEDNIMKQFLSDTEIPQSGVPIPLDFSKSEEIDKICSSCPKFVSKAQSG